ncbi:MAG: NADH-quinone oxidoreductase subunit A [Nocardioidaceae bacterium]
MNPYIPILVIGALGAGFAVFSLGASALAGPKRYNRAKYDSYECGIEPTPQASGGGRVSIKYFITAMMFIVFDIEIIFLYPFAVAFDALDWFALFAMILFLVDVSIAYAYAWARGGLEWD